MKKENDGGSSIINFSDGRSFSVDHLSSLL